MTTSAVVVNHKTPDLASRCARSVEAEVDELLIVDNGSLDGSVAALRDMGFTVLEMGNGGFAAGVNAGMAHTHGDVVLVLNADTELRPGAARALQRRRVEWPGVGVAAPRLLDAAGAPVRTAYRRFPGLWTVLFELCLPLGYLAERWPLLDPYRMRPSDWATGRPVAHVQGAVMAIRRAAWSAVRLDEGYFLYFEETDWQERLARLGWTVSCVAEAAAVHLGRSGAPDSAPAPAYVKSAQRYLGQRGVPAWVFRSLARVATDISTAGLVVLGVLPRRGAPSRRRRPEWAQLRRTLRSSE
ncbi:MAG: hypothetical protein QOE35_1658 [Actinomycetota bacterium]